MTAIKHIVPGNKVRVNNRVLSVAPLLMFVASPNSGVNSALIPAKVGDILDILSIIGTAKTGRDVEINFNGNTYTTFWHHIRFCTEEI